MSRSIVSLLLCMFLATPMALGQDQKKLTQQELAALDEKGYKAAGKGDYSKAIEYWEMIVEQLTGQALQDCRYNLFLAHKKTKHYPEAWHYLTIYLKNLAKEDRKAGRQLEKLEAKLKEKHVKVALVCEPDGVSIYLDEEKKGRRLPCPVTWWFKPGKQKVFAEKSDYKLLVRTLDITERGGKGAFSLKLESTAPPGTLIVKGDKKGFQVFLDGALEGVIPFTRKLKPGEYQLMVGKPGTMPWKKKVVIAAGETTVETPEIAQQKKPDIAVVKTEKTEAPETGDLGTVAGVTRPVKPRKSSKAWKWALLTSGVVLGLGGGTCYLVSRRRYDEIGKKYTNNVPDSQREAYQDKHDEVINTTIRPLNTTAYTLYGLGAAAGVTGLLFLLFDGDEDSPGEMSLTPLTVPGGVGFSFNGGF